jgi:hypothetical protein
MNTSLIPENEKSILWPVCLLTLISLHKGVLSLSGFYHTGRVQVRTRSSGFANRTPATLPQTMLMENKTNLFTL